MLAQFDHSRTLRSTPPAPPPSAFHASSAALLLELFHGADGALLPDLASRVRVGLTLMPQLRGLWGALLPPRLREGAGVWHVKAYVFDNHTVVLSGANLSSDYFTTRQDRYVVVSSAGGAGGAEGAEGVARLAEYLHECVGAVSRLPGGHTLLPDGRVVAEGGVEKGGRGGGVNAVGSAPPSLPPISYTPLPRASPLNAAFAEQLRASLTAWSAGPSLVPDAAIPPGSVLIQPRWQLGLLGVRADEAALLALLKSLPPSPLATLHLATGYFNLPRVLQAALIAPPPPPTPPKSIAATASGTAIHVLTASPSANGFLGAAGVAGAIPLAYSQLEKRFYEAAHASGRLMVDPEGAPEASGIALHEYSRKGWTFHAKGLWLLHSGSHRCTTVVGSSNYGERSFSRDLELQLEFTSTDKGLRERLSGERDALWAPPWVGAVGGHLVGTGNMYGRERNVWDAAVAPERALRWRLAWANGVWIRAGCRALAKFF